MLGFPTQGGKRGEVKVGVGGRRWGQQGIVVCKRSSQFAIINGNPYPKNWITPKSGGGMCAQGVFYGYLNRVRPCGASLNRVSPYSGAVLVHAERTGMEVGSGGRWWYVTYGDSFFFFF